jgi:uridine kinase
VKILIAGNIASGKSTIIREVLKDLEGWTYHAIDDYRAKYGDHTEVGEDSARGAFIRDIVLTDNCIIECSGIGKLYSLIKPQLTHKILVRTNATNCLSRYKERGTLTVMPKEWFKDWTVEKSVKYIEQCHQMTPYDLTVSGASTELSVRQVSRFIQRELKRCSK